MYFCFVITCNAHRKKQLRIRHNAPVGEVRVVGRQKQLCGARYQLVVKNAERLLGKKHRRGMDFGQLSRKE
jgi:hypothetical protein